MKQSTVYLIEKPYKSTDFTLARYEYENKEAAVKRVSVLRGTYLFDYNKYWVEDANGNEIVSPRQTKKQASKIYYANLSF